MGFQMKQLQRFSKTILLSAIFTTVTMSTTVTHAKQYYKWVDSKGSTHYTTTPPPKNARSKSKVNTYGYHGSSTSVTAPSTQTNTNQTAPQNTPPNPVQTGPVANQPANAPTQNNTPAEPVNSEAR